MIPILLINLINQGNPSIGHPNSKTFLGLKPCLSINSTVSSSLDAIKKLRAKKIDAAVDFEFFARSSACLTYLSGAKIRAGFHSYFSESSYRGDLMTHRLNFNSHLPGGACAAWLRVRRLQRPGPRPGCRWSPG